MTDLLYIVEHFDRVWPRLVEHLSISGTALLIALVISLPLGLLLNRVQALATPVLVALGIVYTIPSFALFALLVPLTSIGPRPAIIALTAYSLVVLVRNTMVAFNGVDPAVKEAARGMGMSAARLLWRIEVPLALPVIIAGLRIATLSTIGLTTIAAWIGAGGLGLLLKDGLTHSGKLYAGIIAVAAIAIGADFLFRLVERQVEIPGERRAAKSTPATELAQLKEA